MKFRSFATLAALASLFGLSEVSHAATTSVTGGLTIKGVAPGNTIATLSFIQLNVLNPGHVRIEASYLGGLSGIVAYLYTGVPFGALTIQLSYEYAFNIGPPFLPSQKVADNLIPAGNYLLGIRFDNFSDWDYEVDGFVPTTTLDGGGGINAYFRFAISGDVQPVAFWEGQVDGTFKVTALPEPTTSSAAAIGMGALLARRRRSLQRCSCL